LKGGGGAVLKDLGTNSVWKLAADAAGNIVGHKLDASQVSQQDLQNLPDGQPVAIPQQAMSEQGGEETAWGAGQTMPAQIAGSTTPGPGYPDPGPLVAGQETPVAPPYWDSREQAVPMYAVGAPDPELSLKPVPPGDPVPAYVVSPAVKALLDDSGTQEASPMSILDDSTPDDSGSVRDLLRPAVKPKKAAPAAPKGLMSMLLSGFEDDVQDIPDLLPLVRPKKAPKAAPKRPWSLMDRLLSSEPDTTSCDILAAKTLSSVMARRRAA
ncbi:MAG: hypothetical protein KGI98_15935, partial [Euryarchaeota archaeon]|nr:hypothetical protein [Euryarchaeota archaeon]